MMAEESIITLPKVVLEDNPKKYSIITSTDEGCLLLRNDNSQTNPPIESAIDCEVLIVGKCNSSDTNLNRAPQIEGLHFLTREINGCLKNVKETSEVDAVLSVVTLDPQQRNVTDKENNSSPRLAKSGDAAEDDVSCHDSKTDNTALNDAEIVRRAHEEGRVEVVLPGTVTQEGCCRFVSEILKCILYQRQQLPMTYDQLVCSQKKEHASIQNKEVVSWRPAQPTDFDGRKCHRTLEELEEVFQHLELLFSLSLVPRVLLLLGGSLVLPKELYEIDMEALVLAAGDRSLRVSSCLRQLFRTLFVADLLSDARPVRLMATTVLVLAHRDCGVGWFRPKLDFKVPTRVKRQIIALSTGTGISSSPQKEASDWEDYVWFQAPVAIKGFSK